MLALSNATKNQRASSSGRVALSDTRCRRCGTPGVVERDGLERSYVLGGAVLANREVGTHQPLHWATLLVNDHHVHADEPRLEPGT